MNILAVVELEEGALTVTVAQRRGRRIVSSFTSYVPLTDQSPATLAGALSALRVDRLPEGAPVHVVLGDRRIQHHRCDVPNLPAAELQELVAREAMRLCSVGAPTEVLRGVGPVQRRGGKLQFALAAMPKQVWEPVLRMLQAAKLTAVGAYSTEACLALAATGKQRTAVVETGCGRTRFVVCDGGDVVQVRRFMTGNGSADAEAAGMQLQLELPRTLDWLREAGLGEIAGMTLGPRAHAALQAVQADPTALPPTRGVDIDIPVDEGSARPSLATSALLNAICRGVAPGSMLSTQRVIVPVSVGRVLGMTGAIAVFGAAAWFGAQQHGAWRAAEAQLQEIARLQEEALASRLAGPDAEAAVDPAQQAHAEQLARALGRRRPYSLLLADLAGDAGEVRLDNFETGNDDRIRIGGYVGGASRREALDKLARFLRGVRALPYVRSGSGEEIVEWTGLPHGYRFTAELQWRNG
jgi:hypothetical protein